MTTQCPDNIRIHYSALEWIRHSDYWILDSNAVYHNSEMRELNVDLEVTQRGSKCWLHGLKRGRATCLY